MAEFERLLRESGEALETLASRLDRSVAAMEKENNEFRSRAEKAETRVAELEHSLADAMEQIAAIQGTNAVHMARVEELEGETRHALGELGEGFDGIPADMPIGEAVVTAGRAFNTVVAELGRSECAQKPRPMSEAPENDYILAKCDGTWIEVIMEDGEWCSSATPGKRHNPTSWAPLPEDGKPK